MPKEPPAQSEDVNEVLEMLDKRIQTLKVSYDQYFLGIEKHEPAKERASVNAILIQLANQYIRNTGAKFKRDTLKAKFQSFARYWDRILKQIEDGTYRGHQIKAALHERERLAKLRQNGKAPANGEDTEGETVGVTGPHRVAAAPAAPPSGPAPAAAPNDAVQKIFEQYVAAKRKANEPVEGLTRERMASVISQQTAVLKQKYACKSVEFRVVIEDGKAKLKAVPK